MNNNMEDRLRHAFEHEAEQLSAPAGSLETTVRRGQRRRASTMVGGAALAFVLIGGAAVGFQVAQSDGDPDPETDRNPIAAADIAETTAADETREGSGSAGEIPVTKAFTWEQVELPDAADAGVFDVRVGSLNGTLVAIGQGFSADAEEPSMTVWMSEDGRSWEAVPGPEDFGGGMENVSFSDDGILVVGRAYDDIVGSRSESLILLTSRDARSWVRGTVELQLEENEFAWIQNAAIGDGVFLIAASANVEPPQPPVILEEAGITIQQNHIDGTATLIDTATGDVIADVPIDVIYGYSAEGPTLYDPSGEVIAVIPGEEMDRAYEAARVEAGSSFEFPEELVVEHDDIRLTLIQRDYTFTAERMSTGEVIASGSQENLYRPPRFVVEHPETGEILIDMEWDAFWEAEERSYRFQDDGFEFRARTLLFRSTDGTSWEQIEVPGGSPEGEVMGLTYGPAGFVLSTLTEPTGPNVWQSNDGRSWSKSSVDLDFATAGSNIAATNGYYYTVNSGTDGYGVVRSTDYLAWETMFELNRGTWFNYVAAGELGIVAVGESDTYVEPDITISKDGKTFFLSPDEGVVTVTDDATGEVVASIVFDPYAEDPPDGIVLNEDDSGFSVADADGTVIMTITNQDIMSATEFREPNELSPAPEQIVLFSSDGTDWGRVSTGGLEIGYVTGVAVGGDAVVLSGEPIYPYEEEVILTDEGETTVVTSVTAGEYPRPTVWVGRPS